jgi:SpoVK/Ycf46/Vps4 family AAA+-type ATPase
VFVVDKPDDAQREAIWDLLLRRAGANPKGLDLAALARLTTGLVGRDIRALVDEALGQAFDAGEKLSQGHCEAAIRLLQQGTVPVGDSGLRALPAGGRPVRQALGVIHDAHATA